MILHALDEAGGVDYLVRQAEKNPAAFMTLLSKVLPMQISGEDSGPMIVEVVHYGDAGLTRANNRS